MHSQLDYFNAIAGSYFDYESTYCLVVCSQLDERLISHHCASIAEAQRAAQAFVSSHNVYASLGLVSKPKSALQRGNEADVKVLMGLVVDIDCAHHLRKKSGHFETIEEATASLDKLMLKPSMVVSTGHGIQVYWLWKEPWEIEEPEELLLAKSISKGWNGYVQATLGKTIDPTFALNHIYRVPETINQKYEERPVCEILELNDKRYDPTEFEMFQEEAAAPPALAIKLAPFVEGVSEKVRATISNSQDFKLVWEHRERGHKDESQSGWDWRIGSMMVESGTFTDQEIGEALLANRRIYDAKVKPQRYYERTISKLRANRESIAKEEEGWYEKLSRLVGVKVKTIELADPRNSIEDITYRVLFSSGDLVTVRKDSQIRSHAYWVKSLRGVAPRDQTEVPKVSTWEWSSVIEKLRLHVVMLEQDTAAQDVASDIAAYLRQTSVDVERYDQIRKNDMRPLHYHNQYLFIIKDFMVWYAKLYGRIDRASMRLALEALKASKRRMGPHAVEYVVIREEELREGTADYTGGAGRVRGGNQAHPQQDGDQPAGVEEGNGGSGLPAGEPVH